jgi:lycopene cyclase domain-containing protein
MAHLTYLLILIFSALIPVIFSFEPNFQFYKKLPKLIPAISIGAFIFIIWDLFFTDAGIWGFNESYTLGIKLFNLPLEELLFFIIIPYSCIFLYEAFYYHLDFDPFQKISRFISSYLIIFTSAIAWSNTDKSYTFSAMFFLSLIIFLAEFIFKNKELSKFYLVFLIIIIPFSIDNGILTGSFLNEPIVWYNNNENLGIRLGTIPFEDIFYGMSLVLLDFCLFKSFNKINLRT